MSLVNCPVRHASFPILGLTALAWRALCPGRKCPCELSASHCVCTPPSPYVCANLSLCICAPSRLRVCAKSLCVCAPSPPRVCVHVSLRVSVPVSVPLPHHMCVLSLCVCVCLLSVCDSTSTLTSSLLSRVPLFSTDTILMYSIRNYPGD